MGVDDEDDEDEDEDEEEGEEDEDEEGGLAGKGQGVELLRPQYTSFIVLLSTDATFCHPFLHAHR
jgi:hypothetical protein